MIQTLKDNIFGEKVANSETRHKPPWLPGRFDKRWFGERLAVMSIPPYKPPYRRHGKYKAWVCMGPRYILSVNAIIEVDIDNRGLDIDIYK